MGGAADLTLGLGGVSFRQNHDDQPGDRDHDRPHRRYRRSDQADRLADPQRLHRLLQDDVEPRGRRYQRRAQWQDRGRLRLQLERPLWPGRAHPRALPQPPARSGSQVPARCHRREHRSGQVLGGADVQREAWRSRSPSRPRRASRITATRAAIRPPRPKRPWPRSRASRCSACSPSARAGRPIPRSSSMRRAGIITRARTSMRSAARWRATSRAATRS